MDSPPVASLQYAVVQARTKKGTGILKASHGLMWNPVSKLKLRHSQPVHYRNYFVRGRPVVMLEEKASCRDQEALLPAGLAELWGCHCSPSAGETAMPLGGRAD